MPTLDVFKADGFNTLSLTEAIIKAPYQPGLIGSLGLFRESGMITTVAMVEERSGQLSLIPTSPRGGVPDSLGAAKRKVRSFIAPHLAREANIYADEVQNIRAFGSQTELQTVQQIVDLRLAELRAMHEVTLEYHRIGAIKGVILDADGTTVVYNLFDEFDVVQQTAEFEFDESTADIRGEIVAALRLSETKMGGTLATGYLGLAGATFFDALVGHARVEEAFKYQQGMVLGEDLRMAGFTFGGVVWREYRGAVNKPDGSGTVTFVPAAEAYIVPRTNPSIFTVNFAPADFIETVNTMGLPIYAKLAYDDDFNRYVKIHTSSNPLALCLRPEAVIKCTMS